MKSHDGFGVFTNDDLKQLKNTLDQANRGEYLGDIELSPSEVYALIARLEAAEYCAELLKLHQESGMIYDGDEEDDGLALQAIDAWRKVSGKDSPQGAAGK